MHAVRLCKGVMDNIEDLTRNHSSTIRTMKEVNADQLSKGQTFASKQIIILRVNEEANLRGISMHIEKSDSAKFIC